MAIKKIKINNNVAQDIGADARNVDYVNLSMGVSNVSGALDWLKNNQSETSSTASDPIYKNNPLPVCSSTLKILAIGNSFTGGPTAYFSRLLSGSSINPSSVCLYALILGSSSLKTWSDIFDYCQTNETTESVSKNQSVYWRGGTCDTDNSSINAIRNESPTPSGSEEIFKTMNALDALKADWDIIVVQQVSNYAYTFDSFNPYLANIVRHIRSNCHNPAVCLAFQQIWGTSNATVGWRSSVIKQMIAYNGIDIIIPTYAALENAISTNAFAGQSYLGDGHHIGWGLGKYVAACTWWETLIAPTLGVSVRGNSCTIPSKTAADSSNEDGVPVTSENKELCQMCAIAAVANRYEVSDMSIYDMPTNS